jgi:hypothetical protein
MPGRNDLGALPGHQRPHPVLTHLALLRTERRLLSLGQGGAKRRMSCHVLRTL